MAESATPENAPALSLGLVASLDMRYLRGLRDRALVLVAKFPWSLYRLCMANARLTLFALRARRVGVSVPIGANMV